MLHTKKPNITTDYLQVQIYSHDLRQLYSSMIGSQLSCVLAGGAIHTASVTAERQHIQVKWTQLDTLFSNQSEHAETFTLGSIDSS